MSTPPSGPPPVPNPNPPSGPKTPADNVSWTYRQSSGDLFTPDGGCVGQGYSGRGPGLNNPAQQSVAEVGPIPQGQWTIGEFFDDPGGKGPVVAHLTPAPGTEMFGRDGFMIHGDNQAADYTASEGCVILARQLRMLIQESGVRLLTVAE